MNTSKSRRAARRVRQALAATAISSGLMLSACGDSPEALLSKARESIEKNEPKTAEIHLKNLLQAQDSPEARYLLGKAYLTNGDLAGARKEFARALEDGYDKSQLAPDYATVLVELGEYRRAVEQLADARPAAPAEQAKLQTALGRAQLVLGKQDDARRAYQAALSAQPDMVAPRVALIAMRAASGDAAGATDEIDQVLTQHPDSAEALVLKGDLELNAGRVREARDLYLKAAKADPRERNARIKLATLALQLDDQPAAETAIRELRALTGPAPLTLQLHSRLLLRQGKLEPARDAALAALKAAPDYLPALASSAQAHLALGALQMAEQHARRIVDLAPQSTMGYRLLGATYIQMNAPDKALELLEPLLARGENRDTALYLVAGEAALRANEPDKAIAWLEQARKLDPKNPRNLTALAMAHVAGGDSARGVAELEQAVALDTGGIQADHALVLTHLRDRRFDQALEAIDQLEKKSPGTALAENLRGSVLTAKGDLAGARRHYEEAVRRDPKSFPATASLARLDLRDRQVDAAKKRYTALLEQDPKNIQAMLALAQIAQYGTNVARAEQAREEALAGKLPDAQQQAQPRASQEALEWLRKAREADRSSVPVVLALANWHSANNQPKDAIPLLQEMLAVHKDDVRLLDALGSAYLRTEQPTLALDSFERVLRLRPDSASAQLRMGQLKLAQGNPEGALQNLRRAAELAPDAVEPRAALAAVHLRTGKPDAARAIVADLLKAQPRNPVAIALQGDVAMAEGKFSDAAGAYRRALALRKELGVQTRLHGALLASGARGEADALLASMLKEAPQNPQLRLYAGDVALRRADWARAAEHFEAALERQPNNAIAMNNAAWALHEQNNPRALELAEKAVALAPQSAAVLDTLGVILMAQGNTTRGVEVLRRAVAFGQQQPQVRLHLAEALVKAGDKAAARTEAEIVVNASGGKGPLADRARKLIETL